MKNLILSSCLLILTQVSMAKDYLLDASTMAIGATAGDNLVVKEGCLNPTKTNCTEKLKWLSTPLGKIGSLEIIGTLQGDFEVSITGDFSVATMSVALTDNEHKGIEYSQTGYNICCVIASLSPTGIGEGGGLSNNPRAWNGDNDFNTITITVQNGLAKARINGTQIGKDVTFDPATAFTRAVIQGITPDDRLTEVKIRGLQTICTNNPTPGGNTSTTSSNQIPTIAPNLNLHIPSIEYQSLGGKMNIWVDLNFSPSDDGKLWWTLSDYGVNQ